MHHVPDQRRSLISVGQLDEQASVPASLPELGHFTAVTSSLSVDQRYIRCTRYTSLSESGLFLVDLPVSYLWHGRLGHLSKSGITHLSRAGYIPKLSFSDHQFCEHCQYGKQTSVPHPTCTPRQSSRLDLVNSDMCGPMPHRSLGGASYFMTFIDDSTWKIWAYMIRLQGRAGNGQESDGS